MNANSSNNLSDNYRLRNHFLRTNEIPTPSLIKKKMSAPLAAVYFKSMTPKLKVMVGLEPPMKGGGGDWYVPPESLLDGRTVLKPLKKEYLAKLNYMGIDAICVKSMKERFKCMKVERDKIIAKNDEKWKRIVEAESKRFHEKYTIEAVNKNTEKIRNAFTEFRKLYPTSLNNIEAMVIDASCNEIKRIQQEALQTMDDKYKTLIQQQAMSIYDSFTNRLMTEKLRLKCEFTEKLERYCAEWRDKIHDINLEKHVAIEKSRKYLECQRLACQVYVTLKEREECEKEIKRSEYMHMKQVKNLADEIAYKDYEIFSHKQKEKAQLKFNTNWQNKVLHIVKMLEMFVSYCLSSLPAHAEFFINMEKLMLLQLSEVLENPSADSIFKVEAECYEAPRPEPHPFYLFCDKSHKIDQPRLEKDLCPKHCTSSASNMPVIVINKRCMYAACDNFEQFFNKVKLYIYGKRGDDMDFTDDHIYEYDVPVKYTTSQQLSELKLESSLLQVLQQELSNIREVQTVCSVCKEPSCFCDNLQATKTTIDTHKQTRMQTVSHTASAGNMCNISNAGIHHKAQPLREGYFKSIEPKRCTCIKTAKKHLLEHLPTYMRRLSAYNTTDLPNYETCPPATLKKMVIEARGRGALPTEERIAKTRDMATQFNDEQYDILCTCFSDDELQHLLESRRTAGSKIYHPLRTENLFKLVDYSHSSELLDAHDSSISMDRTHSARVSGASELEEIFKRTDTISN